MHSAIRIALVGDYNELQRAHQAIPRALTAASEGGVETVWISTDSIARGDSLADFDGIWCVPGMPYRNADGAIAAIRYARTANLPFLGTSAGFQYALIEYRAQCHGLHGCRSPEEQSGNDDAADLAARLRPGRRQGACPLHSRLAPAQRVPGAGVDRGVSLQLRPEQPLPPTDRKRCR